MSTPPAPAGIRGVHVVLLVAIVSVVGMTGLLLDRCAGRVLDGEEGEASATIVRPTPSVVAAVRDLARLESVTYHMERVIDLTDRQGRLFGLVLVEDAILLVAAADVTAGVDLAELRDGDVVIEPDRGAVHLTLPRPLVLSTRLDSERTYVHTRQTDVLARRREDLETRARQEAERTLAEAAVSAGILERARANAARTVESLVRSLGYERVEILWATD